MTTIHFLLNNKSILLFRYYNAGELPSEIIEMYPEVVHRLKGNFAVLWNVSQQLYLDPKFEWRKFDAIHLLVNHRRYGKLDHLKKITLRLSNSLYTFLW